MSKTVLITAGPTREYFDRVRFISNASSGQQGKYLAEEFSRRGWRVIVVAGVGIEPLRRKNVLWRRVTSARQMLATVKKYRNKAALIIGAAAVSDYRPVRTFWGKIKSNKKKLILVLKPNPDILKIVSRGPEPRPMLIGFALETGDYQRQLRSARKKLVAKNLDMIILNPLRSMENKNTILTIVRSDGLIKKLPLMSKRRAARYLTNEILRYYQQLN